MTASESQKSQKSADAHFMEGVDQNVFNQSSLLLHMARSPCLERVYFWGITGNYSITDSLRVFAFTDSILHTFCRHMASGESVPLLSTAPEKTLLRKDFWPAARNSETKVKHADFEDFE